VSERVPLSPRQTQLTLAFSTSNTRLWPERTRRTSSSSSSMPDSITRSPSQPVSALPSSVERSGSRSLPSCAKPVMLSSNTAAPAITVDHPLLITLLLVRDEAVVQWACHHALGNGDPRHGSDRRWLTRPAGPPSACCERPRDCPTCP